MEYFILIFALCCVLCCEVVNIIIDIKYHNEIEELKTKKLIRKLTRKYMRLYKKEINNSNVISMREYVIDLVQNELSYKEQTYVKTIYKLYETERKYIPPQG